MSHPCFSIAGLMTLVAAAGDEPPVPKSDALKIPTKIAGT